MGLRGGLVQRIAEVGLFAAAAALVATSSEGAEKTKKSSSNQCQTAWRDAQSRSEAGHLRQARELLVECAAPGCGSTYRQQCAARLARLELDLPTIVPLATDDAGAPMVDVQLKADGQVLALKLDGRSLPLDPGVHELTFSTWARGVFATEKVMILEGQRNRQISVSLHKPAPAPPPPAVLASIAPPLKASPEKTTPPPGPSDDRAPTERVAQPAPVEATAEAPPRRSGRSAVPYLLGGVGLAGIGAGVLLTYWGNKDNSSLSSCSPNCAPADAARIRTLYLASDVSFGAGAAVLGLAGVLFFTSHPSGADRAATDKRPARAAYSVDVQPAPSGAAVSFKGTF